MTYNVFHNGAKVAEFEHYPQANRHVLKASGLSRIYDAVGWHVQSTKPTFRRALISGDSRGGIGKRLVAAFSWQELTSILREASWWVPPGHDAVFLITVEWSDGCTQSARIVFKQDSDGRERLSLWAAQSAFASSAATHEVSDVATDWPDPQALSC